MMYNLYSLFRSKGLTHSQRHFSVELLGASHNYVVVNKDRGPSYAVLLHLVRWLFEHRRPVLALQCLWLMIWPDRRPSSWWWWR